MIDAIIAHPRGVGSNGGWASLVTGKEVSGGPDLSLFVQNRADAYRLVDWVTPMPTERDEHGGRIKRIDRAYVDYRTFEPGWLQVKLIVEEEHAEVLHRLSEALRLRDNYLDAVLIKWAIDPDNHRTPWGYDVLQRVIAEKPDNKEAAKIIRDLLARDKQNTCQHEDTHRGGVLWEICETCDAKWADDEGGKPEWVTPPEWKAAEEFLAQMTPP